MRQHVILAGACTIALLLVPITQCAAQEAAIAVERGAATDARIVERLNAIFAEVDGLAGISIDSTAGVVTLSGTVPDPRLRAQATGIASRMDGVVTVEDRIRTASALAPRMRGALDSGTQRLTAYLSYLPLLLAGLIVAGAFLLLARFIWRRDNLFAGMVSNVFLRNFLRQLTGTAVALVGVLFALDLLDATAVVGAVLGAAGVVGLAIGFAFRDTIENYIAGILLSIRQPFAPHDFISVGGQEGHVARLTSRATVLLSPDGNTVRIPNARVFQDVLVNYSRNPLRRFAFAIGIGTDVDISAAQTLATDTLAAMRGVESEPPPHALVEELGDSNVVLMVRGWVDQRSAAFAKVRSEAIRLVKQRFDEAGFDMPEPIYRLRIESGGIQVDGERARASVSARGEPDRPPSRTAAEADVTPDRHMVEQVEDERERSETEDLLDEHAAQE